MRGVNDFSCEVSRQVGRHCEARERRGNPLTVIARKSLIFVAIHIVIFELVNAAYICYYFLYIFIFSSLKNKEEKTKQKRRNIVVINALRASD